MKSAPLLLFLLFGAAALVRAAENLETEAATFFRDLKQASPALYERLQKEEDLFPKMMQQVVPGLIPATGEPTTPTKGKAPLYPARLVSKNMIFYARVDRIDEEAVQKLLEEMRTTARLANRPCGAILDLRGAAEGDFPSVRRFLALFIPQEEKKPHFFQKIPLVVLCGSKTGGPAELLTILLERSPKGISMGEAGSGNFFPRKEAVLNGRKWLVPEIPDFAPDIPFGAHTPMIECKAYPQISFQQIGKVPIESDSAIRRAIDLLRSLHAIRRK